MVLGWFRGGASRRSPAGSYVPPTSRTTNPFLPSGANDGGWPFVRGPNYDGHSAEIHLADSWPADGPPVLWTRSLGQGYSGFVAAGNRLYTQFQTLAGQYVACLDAGTGETIWTYRYDWPFEATGLYPGPRSTPTLAGGRVYFAAPSGLVGCLTRDGSLLWSIDVIKKFDGKGTGFGYSGTPVVEDGRVFVPVGGKGASLVALDARDGSTIWQSGDDSASYVPVLPITHDGRRLVVGLLENAVVCCDFATGKLVWRLGLGHGYNEHAAWPVYAETYLWFSGPFRSGSDLLRLGGGDEPAVKSVRQIRRMSNDVCSSVLDAGFLYGFDLRDVQAKAHRPSRGEFRCLDLLTFDERWSTDQVGHASVLVADGKLIMFNDTGQLILARADAEKYDELARISLLAGEICWTAPALDRGRIYVRNQTRAVCVYIGRLDLLDENEGSKRLTAADIPQHEKRDLTPLLGVEPEYAFDVPGPEWLRNWYLAGLALLFASSAAVSLAGLAVRAHRGAWIHPWAAKLSFQATAFVLGAVGTTAFSVWRNDFTFTWPVSLFALFQATVDQLRLGKPAALPNEIEAPTLARTSAWRPRVVAFAFLMGCLGYYRLCRELSLLAEWAFLSGFGAAVPFSVARLWLARRRCGFWFEVLLTPLEFSAYYWASVEVLLWKCKMA